MVDGFLDVRERVHLCEDVGLLHQGKGVLYPTALSVLSDFNHLVDDFQRLVVLLLPAQTLALQHQCLFVYGWLLSPVPLLVIVAVLDVLGLVEGLDGVIIIALGHEGLSQGDVHVYMQQLGSK